MRAPASPTLGQYSALPGRLPTLLSPGASSCSSISPPSEETEWALPSAGSLHMSRYGDSKPQHMQLEHTPNQVRSSDATAFKPTSQLPPISSLFGTSSSIRVPQSPAPDPPATHPPASSPDRSYLSSGRSGTQNSYFARAESPVDSQCRTNLDGRIPPSRMSLHALPSSLSSANATKPRLFYHAHKSSQHEHDQVTTEWAVRPEPARTSHHAPHVSHPGSREVPFALKFSSPGDMGWERLEHRLSSNNSGLIPSQSFNSSAEGVAASGGLGPKIWTGTHFLPRYVRSAEVPGEGLCYFYDDGSHCKAVIDGEAVNAHWGVTKAGKPRKRLAIACITCREKKIKCDPDYPRCVQCGKFGRICKFKNAPRGGHNTSPSPSTPPAEPEDYRESGGSHYTYPNWSEPSRSDIGSPTSAKIKLRPSSPPGISKRVKLADDSHITSNSGTRSALRSDVDHPKTHPNQDRPGFEALSDGASHRDLRSNPYDSEPNLTGSIITSFFAKLEDTAVLRFVPEEAFKTWMSRSGKKHSPDDLMVLYGMLAVGMTLSGRPQIIAAEYAHVAQFAQQNSARPCLQLVQTRVLLALYYKLTNNAWAMSESLSAAVGAAAFIQLNAELEASRELTMSEYPLGLTRHGYCEARRRTFWSLFILDNIDGGLSQRCSLLNANDIGIRLPGDTGAFEMQAESDMPFFQSSKLASPGTNNQSLPPAAHLVEVVHLWSKCRSMSRRIKVATKIDEKRDLLEQRLQNWQSELRKPLQFSTANMETASEDGYLGTLATMHFVETHAMMTLSRCQLPRSDPPSPASREHASKILAMVEMLDTVYRGDAKLPTTAPAIWASALVEAVDILSVDVQLSDLERTIDSFSMAKKVFDRLGDSWAEWRSARDLVEERIQRLTRIRQGPSLSRSPMERTRQWAVNDAVPTRHPAAK